jgi:hypothetical protein
MVSLRNVNTVLVFNRHSREIRFVDTGRFVRQHDPDFLDGNRISVYDNRNVGPESNGQQYRILIIDAAEGTTRVHFEGNATTPFYSDIMGKHQWLPNGNLLVVESMRGRSFEMDSEGRVVWEYINYLQQGMIGLVEEVQRIPASLGSHYGVDPTP